MQTKHQRACMLAVLVLLAAGAAAQPTVVDVRCVLSSCPAQASACFADSGCQATTKCIEEGCATAADYATCYQNCFFEYATDAFGEQASCVTENGCATLPPVSSGTCAPEALLNSTLATDFNVSMLAEAGVMYTSGATSVGDCLPCQKLEYSLQPDGGVAAFWSAMYGSTERNASYVLYEVAPGVLFTEYNLFGVQVEEFYYILDYSDTHVFYYFCGELLGQPYYGSNVHAVSEPGEPMPAELAARLTQLVADAGLQDHIKVDQFCKPTNDDRCTNIQ